MGQREERVVAGQLRVSTAVVVTATLHGMRALRTRHTRAHVKFLVLTLNYSCVRPQEEAGLMGTWVISVRSS